MNPLRNAVRLASCIFQARTAFWIVQGEVVATAAGCGSDGLCIFRVTAAGAAACPAGADKSGADEEADGI